ncbi:MAG: hypothetical protein COA42_18430 [Alteromonadaceae bacterium]|nr:MAG: hypothetical protein COA42_18430 [Alteromonadaceae bacterium]
MKKIALLLIASSLSVGMFGCAMAPVDPGSFSLQQMEVRDGVDIKKLGDRIDLSRKTRGRSQVVILPYEGKKISAADGLQGQLKISITEAGGEIIDRGLSKQLSEEVALIESMGKSKYKGTSLANLAIKTDVTNVAFEKRFSEVRYWKDKEGKSHKTPASCSYKAEVSAVMSFYDVNPLALKKTVTISGAKRSSTETRNSSCPISQAQMDSLIALAGQDAILDEVDKIKNVFSPKGIIDEYRMDEGGKTSIFRTTLSPEIGASPGRKVKIWKDVSYTNQFGKLIKERTVIAEAEVVEAVGGSSDSWILVKKIEHAKKVKLGDTVEVDFKRSWKERMMDGAGRVL